MTADKDLMQIASPAQLLRQAGRQTCVSARRIGDLAIPSEQFLKKPKSRVWRPAQSQIGTKEYPNAAKQLDRP